MCVALFMLWCDIIIDVEVYWYRNGGGGGVSNRPLAFGLVVASGRPAATVEYIPTVFAGFGVGLVCNVLSLLVFCVRIICASLLRFRSIFVVTYTLLFF